MMFNLLLVNQHPNMVLIPAIHNFDCTCANEIPCVLLHLPTEGIHLTKVETV